MPRNRSKSRTPTKDTSKTNKKDPTVIDDQDVVTPTTKRRRTRSSSAGHETDESLSIGYTTPTRTSPRRRRASSASEGSIGMAVSRTSLTTLKKTVAKKSKVDDDDTAADNPEKVVTPSFSKRKSRSSITGSNNSDKKVTPSSSMSKQQQNEEEQEEEMPKTSHNKVQQQEESSNDKVTPMQIDDSEEPSKVTTKKKLKTTPSPSNKKHGPTMNVQVHRIRHLDYMPSTVMAMTATSNGEHSGYVALSRQDGSIELHEATSIPEYANRKRWIPHLFPLAIIAGSKRAVAHSLTFCQTTTTSNNNNKSAIPGLIAASPDGTLWTIQFAGTPRQLQSRINSGGGGVFDLTTCHFATQEQCSSLPLVAAACQDGSVRIWQIITRDDDHDQAAIKIQEPPIVTLPTAGAPVLSLAWRCVKQGSDNTFSTEVYAGVADGTIRQYSLELKQSPSSTSFQLVQQQSQLRMIVESRGRRTPTKVWTMQALDDDTLVTGNSLGQVQFWDTMSGTMIQSVNQTELKADVLKLVVTPSQTKLFASGVDARVLCLERANSNDRNWKFTTALRSHTHDVKCMAVVQGKAGPAKNKKDVSALEALVTAGVDTKVCTYVVSEFDKRRPQVYYPWPSQSPVSSTSSATEGMSATRRLLSMQRENGLELYRLEGGGQNKKSKSASSSELIGEIALETQSNLSISCLSLDGQWLASANATRLFLFRLVESSEQDLVPEKVKLPYPLDSTTVVAMHFCGPTLFVADACHTLYAVNLTDEPRLLSKFQLPPHKTVQDQETIPISSLRSSPDGKYIVCMTKSATNSIHVFHQIDNGEDTTYAYYWTIPDLAGARPAAVAVLGDSQLAVATVSFQIYLFDLQNKTLSSWSEARGFPITKWPAEISYRKDFPVRLFGNPGNPSQLIMASFGAFVVVNLNGDLPRHCRMIPETHVRRRQKRGREEDVLAAVANRSQPIIFAPAQQQQQQQQQKKPPTSWDSNSKNCTVCLHYNSMLHLDFLNSEEMVVVEQPWLRVIANFPDALHRRVYGCN